MTFSDGFWFMLGCCGAIASVTIVIFLIGVFIAVCFDVYDHFTKKD